MSKIIEFASKDIRDFEIHWNVLIFDGLSPCQYCINIHQNTKVIGANIMCDTFEKIQPMKEQLLRDLKSKKIWKIEGSIRKLWKSMKQ